MIGIKSSGSFDKTLKSLSNLSNNSIFDGLDRYGQMGVDALARATPQDTGKTAQSWSYRILKNRNQVTIEWYNTNVTNRSNIAILIQYGHGTGTGGYVSGYDYINPAIKPIFDKIADDIWRKVKT